MKLSTKGRYGVKAMVDLAVRYGKEPVFNKDYFRKTKYIGILFRATIFYIEKIRTY